MKVQLFLYSLPLFVPTELNVENEDQVRIYVRLQNDGDSVEITDYIYQVEGETEEEVEGETEEEVEGASQVPQEGDSPRPDRHHSLLLLLPSVLDHPTLSHGQQRVPRQPQPLPCLFDPASLRPDIHQFCRQPCPLRLP